MNKFVSTVAITAVLSLPVAAVAGDLPNGTFVAKFADGMCGFITVSGGGSRVHYDFRPCTGGKSEFSDTTVWNGKILHFGYASLRVKQTSPTAIKGRWKYGYSSSTKTFLRQ